jgi:hypothetical protein
MSSHHAVLFQSAAPLTHVLDEANPLSFAAEYRLPQLGIDDVRTLIAAAYRRPHGTDTIQVLLVATEFITEEAQQALLKIIEEPPLSTRFVFVLPRGYNLLPTLESRFERQSEVGTVAHDISAFREFKNSSYAERIAAIELSTKNKDHQWQQDIKNGLAAYLLTHKSEVSLPALKELEYVVRLLLTRGASNKFLLEHLALTLPA